MALSVPRFRNVSRSARGFTLLELIIVLVVLAALAALVIPTLGFVRDQAKYATGAAGAAEVLNNLELYKSANGFYPARMDSLVNSAGTNYTKANPSATSTATPKMGALLNDDGTYSYMMSNGGITSIVHHDESATDPNQSTSTQAPITLGFASPGKFLTIDPATADSRYLSFANEIVNAAFPNQASVASPQIPADHKLIALGVGSRASNIGTTMTSAPTWPGAKEGKYSRYIAIFDVWAGASGRGQVTLKAVVDTEYGSIASNVKAFKGAAPGDANGVYTTPTSTASGSGT